jgi:Transglycosylase SLT domain/Tape measure protein
MAANNIYIQVDFNSQTAQQNVNALNQAIAQTGPTTVNSSAQATKGLGQINVSVQQTIRAFEQLGTVIAGLGIARALTSLIQMGSEMNRSITMIQRFSESAQEASEMIAEVRAVAAQSIFPVKDLLESAQALKVFGFAGKEVAGVIQTITDQVTAMGGSIGNAQTLVRVFGRILNKEFVTAEDLMRQLPKTGVKVMEALQESMSKQLQRPVDVDEVRKFIKEGKLGMDSIRVILQSMKEQTGGAGAQINDAAKSLKNLGDMLDVMRQKLMSDQGFGKVFAQLGKDLESLMTLSAAVLQWFMDLPEPVKLAMGRIIEITIAIEALNAALYITKGLIPALTIGFRGLGAVLALATPELLAIAAALGGIAVILGDRFPEQAKKVEDWATGLWNKAKETVSNLAKKSGLFPDQVKVPDVGLGSGKPLEENTKESLKKVQDFIDEWSLGASKSLLYALASPAEAVAAKYKELFEKLEKLMSEQVITGAKLQEFRDQLTAAQRIEMDAKVFEKEKQTIVARGKLEEERMKGSYDAQIAYIEAMDEQDLRKKVANIDRITDLRIKSVQEVSQIEIQSLQNVLNAELKRLHDNREMFEKAGVDVDKAIRDRSKETAEAQVVIAQKAIDETEKYRLEGWKKSNDAIIEDQKRIYEAFKSEFDEIFDAFTQKGKTLGQALGDVFKKLFLGEVKNVFSSQLASAATQLSGYGKPEEPISRSGGVLSMLFMRGMAPRAPGPPPETYLLRGLGESGFKPVMEPEAGTAGAAGVAELTQPANRFVVGVDTYNTATARFALAVEQFAGAGGGAGGGDGSAGGLQSVMYRTGGGGGAGFGGAFQAASQATGVPESLLRAVAGTESAFNPSAVSPKGAMGLMQLMPGTARDLGVTNPFDPGQSVMGGARYLQSLLQRYHGDIPSAVAAYNMGPAGFDRAVRSGRTLPRETQDYVARIQSALGQQGTDTGGGAWDTVLPIPTVGGGAGGGILAPGVSADAGGEPSIFAPVFGGGAGGGDVTVAGAINPSYAGKNLGEFQKLLGFGMGAFGLGGGGKGGGGLGGILGGSGKGASGGGLANLLNLSKLKETFGIGQTASGGTSIGSVLGSPGVGNLAFMGGTMLMGAGLQKHSAATTIAGGALTGVKLGQMLGMGYIQGPLFGAGLGLFAAGVQHGGGLGVAMDVGGGALSGAMLGLEYGGPVGALVGAGVGAAVGAVTGVVRLFVKTEQEKIRAQIKQIYGVDIPNRQILTQIQQIVDQKYGGNVQVGVHSQDVMDLVRLYALSSGQAANMPRPMYNAVIAQSTQGMQLQPTYQGGVQVQNPYTGTTSYQYSHAAITAQGANPSPGSGLGVPGGAGLINTQFQQLTLQTIQGNPSAIAMASAAAAQAGDSRLTTTAAMQEPLTALS